MYIKEIVSQNRRDFQAVYKCEHCGNEIQAGGYDDDNFHKNVIPMMMCHNCKQFAGKDYKPRKTKYEAWETI